MYKIPIVVIEDTKIVGHNQEAQETAMSDLMFYRKNEDETYNLEKLF